MGATMFQNVSERKRSELALRESEERFRQFADASSDVLWMRDGETLAATYVSSARQRYCTTLKAR